jgi:hypothetical protein
MGSSFEVHGEQMLKALDLAGTNGLIRTLCPDSIRSYKGGANAAGVGVYVFSLTNTGTPKPWYVGLTKKQSLASESMTADKLRKYSTAMFGRTGKPSITLLTPCTSASKKDIEGLEMLLIWMARAKNPLLLNERKISGDPKSIITLVNKISIRGVLNTNPGQPTNAAQAFKAMMGLV